MPWFAALLSTIGSGAAAAGSAIGSGALGAVNAIGSGLGSALTGSAGTPALAGMSPAGAYGMSAAVPTGIGAAPTAGLLGSGGQLGLAGGGLANFGQGALSGATSGMYGNPQPGIGGQLGQMLGQRVAGGSAAQPYSPGALIGDLLGATKGQPAPAYAPQPGVQRMRAPLQSSVPTLPTFNANQAGMDPRLLNLIARQLGFGGY